MPHSILLVLVCVHSMTSDVHNMTAARHAPPTRAVFGGTTCVMLELLIVSNSLITTIILLWKAIRVYPGFHLCLSWNTSDNMLLRHLRHVSGTFKAQVETRLTMPFVNYGIFKIIKDPQKTRYNIIVIFSIEVMQWQVQTTQLYC